MRALVYQNNVFWLEKSYQEPLLKEFEILEQVHVKPDEAEDKTKTAHKSQIVFSSP